MLVSRFPQIFTPAEILYRLMSANSSDAGAVIKALSAHAMSKLMEAGGAHLILVHHPFLSSTEARCCPLLCVPVTPCNHSQAIPHLHKRRLPVTPSAMQPLSSYPPLRC